MGGTRPGQMAVSPSIIGGLKGLLSARVAIHRERSNAMIAGLCRALQRNSLNGIIMEHHALCTPDYSESIGH